MSTSNNNHHPRRSWKPDGDAHLIFQWVKMEGKSQGLVASMLNISQSTVSRIIQRYERWQAHAKDREDGRLDPAERLRAQRWLTFERNELILASCLRIAHEMEGFIDTSKSTIRRPFSSPSQESEVRTEHGRIDRSGVAARFLRLAFRINMEQLKLAELAQPPMAQPLSEEELAEEDRQAAADAAELAAARGRREWAESEADVERAERQSEGKTEGQSDAIAEADSSPSLLPSIPPSLSSKPVPEDALLSDHSPTHHSPSPTDDMHNLHNENPPKIAASSNEPCSCRTHRGAEINTAGCCISDGEKQSWPDNTEPTHASNRRRPIAEARA